MPKMSSEQIARAAYDRYMALELWPDVIDIGNRIDSLLNEHLHARESTQRLSVMAGVAMAMYNKFVDHDEFPDGVSSRSICAEMLRYWYLRGLRDGKKSASRLRAARQSEEPQSP